MTKERTTRRKKREVEQLPDYKQLAQEMVALLQSPEVDAYAFETKMHEYTGFRQPLPPPQEFWSAILPLALSHHQVEVRVAGVRLTHYSNAKQKMKLLVAAARDKHYAVRQSVARVIDTSPDKELLELVPSFFSDPEPAVRIETLISLIGPPFVRAILEQYISALLEDSDQRVVAATRYYQQLLTEENQWGAINRLVARNFRSAV